MVEHELHVGAKVDQRDRLVDLVGPHAEIERPTGSRQAARHWRERSPTALTSSGTTCSTRRKPLTNGLASWRSRNAGKSARSGRQALIAPITGLRGAFGGRFDLTRLGLDVALGDIDLHVQRRADAAAKGLGLIALKQKVVIERRLAGEPRIGERAAVDQMQVGVENARIGHDGLKSAELARPSYAGLTRVSRLALPDLRAGVRCGERER